MTDELRRADDQLARRHGAYLSYVPEPGPCLVEDHGQPPAELVDRLLDLSTRGATDAFSTAAAVPD